MEIQDVFAAEPRNLRPAGISPSVTDAPMAALAVGRAMSERPLTAHSVSGASVQSTMVTML